MLDTALFDRATACLKAGTLDEAETILRELHSTAGELDDQVEKAREQSLDPFADVARAATARQAMEAGQFAAERLAALSGAVSKRIADLKASAARAAIRAEFKQVEAERDALASLLADRYPKLVAELVDLARQIVASDARISRLNASGMGDRLDTAEVTVRGPEAHRWGSIAAAMRLPNFEASIHVNPMAWPSQDRTSAWG